MNNDYKIEDQLADKKSEGSCRLSKSRKIKKQTQKPQKAEKQRQKTPKITNFFKKLAAEHIQRPNASSQKKQLKRSPEQEQQIEELHHQQRELQHEQELLKKEIQTLKSEEQIMYDQSNGYLKKLRQCQIVDLKQRYEIIRRQKHLPDCKRHYTSSFQHDNSQSSRGISKHKMSLEVGQIRQKISQKCLILSEKSKKLPTFQRRHLQADLQNLQTELQGLLNQSEQYQQRLNLASKQKNCKFAQMNWPLINKRYQILQLIGAGGYSQVYKGFNVHMNSMVAVKLCSVNQMAQFSAELYLKHLFRQCQTHKRLNHQNIVKLHEVIQLDKTTFCLVLQFCQGPQLSKYLKRKRYLPQDEAKQIMFQIFQTLYYLNNFSNKKIVHYDLKPQNIMFHKGLIKILDFGLNKQIDQEESRAALTSVGMGTHAYLPPQIHEYDEEDDKVLTSKVDIWSAGIIFYQLLHGKRPTKIEDIEMQNTEDKIINQQTINIIKKCLKLNPVERISPKQIYFHSYFNGYERKYSNL